MVENILGGGQSFADPGWVDCTCAAGCEGQPYMYLLGYSDGVFAIKNPKPK